MYLATCDVTKKVVPVCSTKHVLVNYCNKGSQVTQVGSHGIEASYITVHSYDILVINTRPRAITKISYLYCDITNT